MIFELVYCSIGRKDIAPEEITAILAKSNDYNSKNNITGCLLYYNNEFIQILEGEEDAVRELFAKIAEDSRHSKIRLLADGYKEERIFENWHMAYVKLNIEDVSNMTKDVFADNFITFAEMADKASFPSIMFWSRAVRLIKKR